MGSDARRDLLVAVLVRLGAGMVLRDAFERGEEWLDRATFREGFTLALLASGMNEDADAYVRRSSRAHDEDFARLRGLLLEGLVLGMKGRDGGAKWLLPAGTLDRGLSYDSVAIAGHFPSPQY